MKDAKIKEVLTGWFWAWLGIAVVLSAVILMVPSHKEVLSSIILATFMVMPVRNGAYRLVVWLIDYMTSNNTNLRDRINPHATYNRLINPTERFDNPGFYRMLWFVTAIASVLLGLLWMIFKGTSFNIVYAWLRSLEFLVRGKYAAWRLFFFVLVKAAHIYGIIWAWGQILNAKMFDDNGRFSFDKAWWRILLMVVIYFGNVLLSAALLKFTASMTLANLLYKTVLAVFGIPILYFLVWRVGKLLFPNS